MRVAPKTNSKKVGRGSNNSSASTSRKKGRIPRVVEMLTLAADEHLRFKKKAPQEVASFKSTRTALGCARKTFHQAIEFRHLAMEELYGHDRFVDSPRSIWWDLSNEARGYVLLEAAGLAFDELGEKRD
jgi:hypothetical protein